MPNSTTTLASMVAYVRTFPELAPLIQSTAGGASLQPALTIANDVMIELIAQAFNWKWNRFLVPVVYTNSYQQDYALPTINLGWLEHGYLIDINNTATPQPQWPLETVKDLESTSCQYGRAGQVSWLPNDQLQYATWGAANPGSGFSPNPQPLTAISTPIGVTAQPQNPYLQIKDPNGNFWIVTTFGVTGASQPSWTNPPVFPTVASPLTVASTITDGSVVWTAVNPKGQGLRLNPIPPASGVVYQLNLIGQNRAFTFSNGPFTALSQTIEPVPDDFAKWFRDGFVAFAYEHSSEAKIIAKAEGMKRKWKESLMESRMQGDRERDNAGFYPATSILQQPFAVYPGPAYPYNLPWG